MANGGTEPALSAKRSLRHATRAERIAARREAILSAALNEFSARGFEAARLDDVAKRAGVVKGTIYQHFPDKEALFEELIRWMFRPLVGTLKANIDADMPARMILERVAELFVRDVYHTSRKEVMRLLIIDGVRFPRVADSYYREVVVPVNDAVRTLLRRALDRGEITENAMVRFPQLLVAPWVVAIVWRGLFEHLEPLDVRGLLRAHLDQLFGAGAAQDGP